MIFEGGAPEFSLRGLGGDWDVKEPNSREHDSQCTQNSKAKQDKLKIVAKITEVAPDGPLSFKNEIP